MQDSAVLFKSLLAVMEKLRGEGGCPWDREQTHESIRSYCIEEAYEVVEAIDKEDPKALCEELGDLLLQVVFHAQMAKEAGTFTIEDVLTSLNEKLIRRHPHVFASERANTAQDVMVKWTESKQKEGRKHLLEGLPKHLPALQRAWRAGEKLASVGFDWKAPADVVDKVVEELAEIHAAPDAASREEEFGDFLFAICQWGRHQNIDAETALRRANSKFEDRVKKMEDTMKLEGAQWADFSAQQLDELWTRAKQRA